MFNTFLIKIIFSIKRRVNFLLSYLVYFLLFLKQNFNKKVLNFSFNFLRS